MYSRILATAAALLILIPLASADEGKSFEQAVRLLRSRYLSDREAGAAVLSDRAVVSSGQLVGLLADDDARVASAAAVALINRGETDAAPAIFALLRRSPSTSPIIIPLLPGLGPFGYDGILFTLAASPDSAISRPAAKCIAKYISVPSRSSEVMATLIGMMRSNSLDVRMTAESILADAGPAGVKSLTEVLAGPFPANISACIALSNMGADAAEPLIAFIRERQSRGNESVLAAEALCAITPAISADSFGYLLASPNELVRARAAEALGKLSSDQSGPLFNAALNDPSADVRAAALGALSRLKVPPDRLRSDLIVSRLGDAFPGVRSAALLAAANFKLPAAVPMWPSLLVDPSREIAANALWTAGNFGDASLAAEVRPFLKRSDPERVAAAKSLLQMGIPEGEGVLIAALDSRDPPRKYAIYGLSFARDRAAVEAILSKVRTLSAEEQQVARFSLFSISGAMLEIADWPAWWAKYGIFWNASERAGITSAFIGDLYERAGLLQVAREYYDRAAELAPSYPWTHDARARMLLNSGDPRSIKAALEAADKAVSMLPTPEFCLTLARAFVALGMYEQAIGAVRKGLSGADKLPALVELDRILREKSPK